MKILYVEDNDDNAYMLKNRLSRAGFTVIVATNAAQGIAMASSEQPDLILMDVTLPDIGGEEATRRIKADPATKQIPVIALTANARNVRTWPAMLKEKAQAAPTARPKVLMRRRGADGVHEHRSLCCYADRQD
jgi:CheY-like chemotaxis protein